MRRIILPLLLMLFALVPSVIAEDYIFNLTAINSSGSSMLNVNITIGNSDGTWTFSQNTTSDGTISISNLSLGLNPHWFSLDAGPLYSSQNFSYNITQNFTWVIPIYSKTQLDIMSYEVAVTIGFGIVSFVFAYLGLNLKTEKLDKVLRLIFIACSLFFMSLTIALASTVSTSQGASVQTLNLINIGVATSNYVIWIFFALTMVGFLIMAIMYFISAGKLARKVKH